MQKKIKFPFCNVDFTYYSKRKERRTNKKKLNNIYNRRTNSLIKIKMFNYEFITPNKHKSII
jgi:hypothetical protein